MKKYLLIALAAAALLSYCIFLLMQVPVPSGSLLTVLMQSSSEDVHLVLPVAGICVSLFILVILAGKTAKVVADELHLDHVMQLIVDMSPRLKTMESRNEMASSLLSDLRKLEPRLKALEDPNNGLAALEAKLRSECERISGRVDQLVADNDERFSAYTSLQFDETVERLEKLEMLHRDLPNMIETAETFEVRTVALEHDDTGLIVRLESLLKIVDDLSDRHGDGRITDLENGSPNSDYTLEEDVAYLEDKVSEVREDLAELVKQAKKIGEIRKSLADLAVKESATAAAA